MKKLFMFVLNFYSLLFLIITFVSFLFFYLNRKELAAAAFLHAYLFWNVGIRGVIAYVANTYPASACAIAQAYNWEKSSHLQTELAAYNGSLGILGIMSLWFTGGPFWLATLIGSTVSCILAEVLNLRTIFKKKYHSFGKIQSASSYIITSALFVGMHLDVTVACFSLVLGLYTLL